MYNKKMNSWKLRLTHKEVGFKEALPLVENFSVRYIGALEGVGTANPHSHWYFETNDQEPAIRARIRKFYSDKGCKKGQRNYNLKTTEKDPPEYITYIYKENLKSENIVVKDMKEDFLEECRIQSQQISSEIKEKNLAKTQWKKFVLANQKWCEEQDWDKEDIEDVLSRKYLEWYIEEGKTINLMLIKNSIVTLLINYNSYYKRRAETKIIALVKDSFVS